MPFACIFLKKPNSADPSVIEDIAYTDLNKQPTPDILFCVYSRDNYLCLLVLLFDIGNCTLREYFKQEWPAKILHATAGKVIVKEWLDNKMDGQLLLKYETNLKISGDDRAKVSAGNTKNWDFSLLTKVLIHSSFNFADCKGNGYLKTLRSIRNNDIAHADKPSLSNTTFNASWKNGETALLYFGAKPAEITEVLKG